MSHNRRLSTESFRSQYGCVSIVLAMRLEAEIAEADGGFARQPDGLLKMAFMPWPRPAVDVRGVTSSRVNNR
jgi:hypothetical protein